MRNGFLRSLGVVTAMYFIGSAAVAQAQDAELPFTPVLTIGLTNLQNDQVIASLSIRTRRSSEP